MEEGAVEDADVPWDADDPRSEAHAYAMWEPSPLERGLNRLAGGITTTIVLWIVGFKSVDHRNGLTINLMFLGLVVVAAAARRLWRGATADRTRSAWRWVAVTAVVGFVAGAATFVSLDPAAYVLTIVLSATTASLTVEALVRLASDQEADLGHRWRRSAPGTFAVIALSGSIAVASIVVRVVEADPQDVPWPPPVESSWQFSFVWSGLPDALLALAAATAAWALARCVKPFRELRALAKDLRVPVV
ncbi:hypothetical protein [Dermatobacter hominis]|uniref:hypothetical protein n=1 Tax=Dermatobacter hominis TaxID=2884263 RepID=UPI001D10C687|nr:hypothetical protein [Dermatobacter hominis]UDY34582.1 hypothetical protein LH044_14715 [Dermatobacter hominis]